MKFAVGSASNLAEGMDAMLKNFKIKSSYKIALPLAFAINIMSFVFTIFYTQNRLQRLDETAVAISEVAAPSIIFLAQARTTVSTLRSEMTAFVLHPQAKSIEVDIKKQINELKQESESYLALQLLPDELGLWTKVQQEVNNVIKIAEIVLAAVEAGNLINAKNILKEELIPEIDKAGEAITNTIEHDAKVSAILALEIETIRKETGALSIILGLFSVLISVIVAFILLRILNGNQKLVENYNRLLTEKVNELDLFAGRIAHDIKNPLSSIGMAAQLIEESNKDNSIRPYFDIVRRSLTRATTLSDDLLAYAKAAGVTNRTDSADVRFLLHDLESSYILSTKQAGIELLIVNGQPVFVATSAGVLTSVLENLLRNAIKFIVESPVKKIHVRNKIRGEMLRFEIEDTGPGIPFEIRARIFEPFVRGENSHIEGTGLGLATAKRLVEAHGGRIGVKSSESSGSIFWFELPIKSKRRNSEAHRDVNG